MNNGDILAIVLWSVGSLITSIFCIIGMIDAVKNTHKENFNTAFGFFLVGLSPLAMLVSIAIPAVILQQLVIKWIPGLIFYLMKKKS